LKERPASLGELKRFAQKFGIGALIDNTSPAFSDLGLRHARMSDESWLGKLVEEPLLLRMPLVRNGNQLTIGLEESKWKEWTAR
jgi:arsenate reductase-like glutaredoxin family protein